MMYTVLTSKLYDKMLDRLMRTGKLDKKALKDLIRILAGGGCVPAKYKDHKLKGEMYEYRECHIKHDLLLKYYKDGDVLILILVEIGTHSQMFGK